MENAFGLSLVATKPLQAEQVVVSVPHTAILSVDYKHVDLTLKAIIDGDEMTRVMGNVALVMILAHETLKEESAWGPYIQMLPDTFPTPLFYSPEELQALKPSPIYEEALHMYRSVARQFVYFLLRILGDTSGNVWFPNAITDNQSKLQKKTASKNASFAHSPFSVQNFTFDFYRWCVSAVSTRINMIPSIVETDDEQPKMIPSLIPFVDFANHDHKDHSAGTIFYSGESSSAHLQVRKDVDAGAEVLIYYGVRSNLKFLLHNGFVPSLPNPDNCYELKIGMPKSSESTKKRELLRRKSIEADHHGYYVFQLSLETASMPLNGSALWEFALTFVSDRGTPPSGGGEATANEAKAKKFLGDRFRLLLLGYAKLPESEPEGSLAEKSVWRLKQSEKEILGAYAKRFDSS
ncbi:Protein SET-27 [Aphelenchoides avenae]|nr:Protein SET-27 [Aphelenchus avenae]